MKDKKNSVFKRNLLHLLGLAVVTAAGSLLLGVIVQRQPLQGIDDFLYLAIYRLPHSPLINKIIYPFDLWFFTVDELHMPAYFYIWLGLFLAYLAFFKRKDFIWAFVTLILGTFLAGWILSLDWHFIFRERPFVHLPTTLHPGYQKVLAKWPSFPSGHVRDTAMFSVIITHYLPSAKWFMVFFCLFIGFLRIYSGAHYPFDSIGGILIGVPTGFIAIKAIEEVKIIYTTLKNGKEKKSL